MPIWTRVGWNCKHETLRHPYQSKLNPAIPSHWLVQKTALFSSCLAFSSRKVNQITKTISLYGWADQSPDARHGIAVLAASSCPCQNQWYSCCCRARSHCLQQLLYRWVDKSSASYHSLGWPDLFSSVLSTRLIFLSLLKQQADNLISELHTAANSLNQNRFRFFHGWGLLIPYPSSPNLERVLERLPEEAQTHSYCFNPNLTPSAYQPSAQQAFKNHPNSCSHIQKTVHLKYSHLKLQKCFCFSYLEGKIPGRKWPTGLKITFQESVSSSASLSELAILHSILQPKPSKIKATAAHGNLKHLLSEHFTSQTAQIFRNCISKWRMLFTFFFGCCYFGHTTVTKAL